MAPAAPDAPDGGDASAKVVKSASASREDNLMYDLKHLAAFDISPLDPKMDIGSYTRDSVQLLVNKIFALPRQDEEAGPCAILPLEDVFRLPRRRPVPKEKPMTRWQKFMEERNIKKRKRSRLVWDEIEGDWKPRWGYKSIKKNKEGGEAVIEVKKGENPLSNPFEKMSAEKKLLVARQKMREVRNKVEAAGGKMRAATPDLFSQGTRGKEGLKEAIKRAQVSSGSLGKFGRIAPGEATNLQQKRRRVSHAQSAGDEKDRYLKFADRTLSGDGLVDGAKAARIGAAATEGIPRASNGKSEKKRRSKQGGKNKKKGRR